MITSAFPRTTLVPRPEWSLGEPPVPSASPVASVLDGSVMLFWGFADADGGWVPYQELKDGLYGPPHEIEWPFGSEDHAPEEAFTRLGFVIESL